MKSESGKQLADEQVAEILDDQPSRISAPRRRVDQTTFTLGLFIGVFLGEIARTPEVIVAHALAKLAEQVTQQLLNARNAQREFEPECLPPQTLVRNLFNSNQETHNWRGLGC